VSIKFAYRVLPLFALPLGACEGCIDLDDYVVVPSDGAPSSGGAGGTTSNACAPGEEGQIFVLASNLEPRLAEGGACALPERPGIDLLALAPRDGQCVARARLTSATPDQVRVLPQVRHTTSGAVAVAGSFAGSALEFPLACNSSASVSLAAPPGAASALFAARLRLLGGAICTEWAHRAWSEEAGAALEVRSFEHTDDGRVLVAGALGGALTRFEGSGPPRTVGGGAFFAVWTASGSLDAVTALVTEPGATDAALAIAPLGSGPMVAGAAKLEDPACHGCSGVSHVTDAALSCPVIRDAGSDAGDASNGDAASDASVDATADAEAGAAPAEADAADGANVPARSDWVNAFVFAPREQGGCARFESFGSDQLGSGDAQAIFDISRRPAACRAYAAGAAGRNTWRIVGNDPKSSIAPGRDENADGFLVRFGVSGLFGCTQGVDFNLRFSTIGVVTGERARAHCDQGVTAAVLARELRQASLVIERCSTADGCDPASTSASLEPALGDQIVVMGLADDGELRWHGSFGPVGFDARPRPAAGSAPLMDLALDERDDAYLLVVVDGPLRSHNVELSRCSELSAENPAPGVWIVKLSGSGFGDRGGCRWARHLG